MLFTEKDVESFGLQVNQYRIGFGGDMGKIIEACPKPESIKDLRSFISLL